MTRTHLDDEELVKAYEQSLELTRQIGRTIRHRRERIQSIIDAVKHASMESDEWATGGPVCGGIHPDYAAQTHCCYVPPEEVDHIEACGE